MDQQRYFSFLSNPCGSLNQGNVSQLRLHSSMETQSRNIAVDKPVEGLSAGAVPLQYQSATASAVPVFIRYDDTSIPQTSAVWVSRTNTGAGDCLQDHAYYLNWGENTAYAVELGSEAKLFFTAELTGCGIIVLSGTGKTVLVHHNIQVTPPGPTYFQKLFESTPKKMAREAAAVAQSRTDSLYLMLQDIVASTPGLTSGKMLGVHQYGAKASFFGINNGGRWRFYLNMPGGQHYMTKEVFG